MLLLLYRCGAQQVGFGAETGLCRVSTGQQIVKNVRSDSENQCPWAICGVRSPRVKFTSAVPWEFTVTDLLQIMGSEKTGRFTRTCVAMSYSELSPTTRHPSCQATIS